ncbi:hypothetical protein [Microcystis sp. M061S2]|uniref:hypothetical protein n=1 Tax=Microcystis sp. M061S2 TaxID=2771171 RepID=UPI002585A81B|nr:hypothetical protein [Microcystis sp. M061S2]MCA2655947.1 hypothetical protein [Microcystis sp. M061S2]
MYQLSDRDKATIFAALRHWQATVNADERNAFPHFAEDIEPLSDEEIDALCELMNTETVALSQ